MIGSPRDRKTLKGQQTWAQPLGWPLSHWVCWVVSKVVWGYHSRFLSVGNYIQDWGSHKSDFHNITQYGSKMCHGSVTGVTCDTTRCGLWQHHPVIWDSPDDRPIPLPLHPCTSSTGPSPWKVIPYVEPPCLQPDRYSWFMRLKLSGLDLSFYWNVPIPGQFHPDDFSQGVSLGGHTWNIRTNLLHQWCFNYFIKPFVNSPDSFKFPVDVKYINKEYEKGLHWVSPDTVMLCQEWYGIKHISPGQTRSLADIDAWFWTLNLSTVSTWEAYNIFLLVSGRHLSSLKPTFERRPNSLQKNLGRWNWHLKCLCHGCLHLLLLSQHPLGHHHCWGLLHLLPQWGNCYLPMVMRKWLTWLTHHVCLDHY